MKLLTINDMRSHDPKDPKTFEHLPKLKSMTSKVKGLAEFMWDIPIKRKQDIATTPKKLKK